MLEPAASRTSRATPGPSSGLERLGSHLWSQFFRCPGSAAVPENSPADGSHGEQRSPGRSHGGHHGPSGATNTLNSTPYRDYAGSRATLAQADQVEASQGITAPRNTNGSDGVARTLEGHPSDSSSRELPLGLETEEQRPRKQQRTPTGSRQVEHHLPHTLPWSRCSRAGGASSWVEPSSSPHALDGRDHMQRASGGSDWVSPDHNHLRFPDATPPVDDALRQRRASPRTLPT